MKKDSEIVLTGERIVGRKNSRKSDREEHARKFNKVTSLFTEDGRDPLWGNSFDINSFEQC